MDTKALSIVRDYINEHLDITDYTANSKLRGDNRLTVETAVQPSKVFVKFEG